MYWALAIFMLSVLCYLLRHKNMHAFKLQIEYVTISFLLFGLAFNSVKFFVWTGSIVDPINQIIHVLNLLSEYDFHVS